MHFYPRALNHICICMLPYIYFTLEDNVMWQDILNYNAMKIKLVVNGNPFSKGAQIYW